MKRMFSAITSNLTVKFFKLFSKRKGVNNPTLQETAEVRKEGLGINAKEFTNFCKPQKKIKLHELRPNLCPPYQDLKRPTHLVLEGGAQSMRTITTLPDLARSAKLLKLSVDLGMIPPENMIQITIHDYLKQGKIMGCLSFIMEGITDNKEMMKQSIGEKLVMEITEFMPEPGSVGAMAD